MSLFSRWRFALKLASWPKLLVPAVLGQALGLYPYAPRHASVTAAGLGLLFTVCLTSFIVLMNDWRDQDIDALKRKHFPNDCSPKTIPDGVLSSRAVLLGGVLAGAMALMLAAWGEHALGRPGLTWLAVGCLAVFAAYTLPPIQLNYRGGGELLEMLGVGFVLPCFHLYLQSGTWVHTAWMFLIGVCSLSLASALASGLSDEESDRDGGKRTFTTMLGNATTRHGITISVWFGVGAWGVLPWLSTGRSLWSPWWPWWPWWLVVPPMAWLVVCVFFMQRVDPAPETHQFVALRQYKQWLHRGIWGSMTLLAGLITYFHWTYH